MGKRENEDVIGLATIDNRIGEPFNENLPQAAADRRADIWMSEDELDGVFDLVSEGQAKAGELRFVEEGSLTKLGLPLAMKPVASQRRERRTSAKTSGPRTVSASPR